MSLTDWLNNGWLVEHKTSPQEIADLFGVADRDLTDCQAARGSHHYRVIQSLAHTTQANTGQIAQFDQFRKKRNIGGYERAGLASDQEVNEMFELARQLVQDVEKWIRANHPVLL